MRRAFGIKKILACLASCAVLLVAMGSCSSTSGDPGTGGGASGCRSSADCTGTQGKFPNAECLFADGCLGDTVCGGLGPPACQKDADCQGDNYCRVCSAGGSGVCAPRCDGGDCAQSALAACTTDSDCPAFCINGLCAEHLGICNSCI